MATTIRQSNIFGDFDWRIAYESFMGADYVSYDYDSIYQSMVQYLQDNYADEFNDYIRHSELLAHVNLFAYLGQSIAFTNDVNAIENFMDDAKRKQSIINIAHTLTYRPERNIASNGMLKIMSIKTTESILASDGFNLQNMKINWNEEGNTIWYDAFIKIINSALNKTNKFGKPYKREERNDTTRFEIYELRQKQLKNYVYPFSQHINGEPYPFEIVPSDLDEQHNLVERFPATNNPFTVVYRNEGNGNNSSDTGFFVQFKQGVLQYRDFYYTTPKIDRKETIDIKNINNSDVWVQEIDEHGNFVSKWTDIPSKIGQNVIYNELDITERNLYISKTLSGDRVQILYGDGNFSQSPTNYMRVWVRPSSGDKHTIRKNDFFNIEVQIPYINDNGVSHTLTVTLVNLEDSITSEKSQNIPQIKKAISENHFNQDRMVTIEDYNVFPSNDDYVKKIKTINRNNAGKGRYPHLKTHDPTGMHSNLNVLGVDGYIFEEYYETKATYEVDNEILNENIFTNVAIEPLLQNEFSKSFYINRQFLMEFLRDSSQFRMDDYFPKLTWYNLHVGKFNKKGHISGIETLPNDKKTLIRDGSKILFLHENRESWATIISIQDTYMTVSDYIPDNATVYMVIPSYNTELNSSIKSQITNKINSEESFGLRYDLISGTWKLIQQDQLLATSELYDIDAPQLNHRDDRWFVQCRLFRNDNYPYYDIRVRGQRLVFGSEKQVRFHFVNTTEVLDIVSGIPSLDTVGIIKEDETYGVSEIKPTYERLLSKNKSAVVYLGE